MNDYPEIFTHLKAGDTIWVIYTLWGYPRCVRMVLRDGRAGEGLCRIDGRIFPQGDAFISHQYALTEKEAWIILQQNLEVYIQTTKCNLKKVERRYHAVLKRMPKNDP